MNRAATYKNIFEIDNARNETPDSLARKFVLTNNFSRLLTAKNHIVLGSRGSGKTALVKMLSHPYLSKCPEPQAIRAIRERKIIGCYIPMRIEWVGGLKNKSWLSGQEQLELFEWRLNLASCLSFISTIKSCINSYISDEDKCFLVERNLAKRMAEEILSNPEDNLYLFEKSLEKIEFQKQKDIFSSGIEGKRLQPIIGPAFHAPLFAPLKRMISILKEHIDFPEDAAWLVCLDEAEFLSSEQQKALNSHLRSDANQIFFKMTTMPYCHYTLETTEQAPIVHREDFDYIYIDTAFSKYDRGSFIDSAKFIDEMISRRIKQGASKSIDVKLHQLLGFSRVLGESINKREDYGLDQQQTNELVKKHCNESTIQRADELLATSRFDDQIKRKLAGALLLKDTISTLRGNQRMTLYSGREMFLRCSDGNPRRAISLLNNMILQSPESIGEAGFKPIPSNIQNSVYERHAKVYLNRLKNSGNEQLSVYDIVNVVGNAFSLKLHSGKLGTDLYGLIKIDDNQKNIWPLIVYAVGLGALYPIVNSSQPDELPEKEGLFRLSYAFAAHFRILPRKGKYLSLQKVLNNRFSKSLLDSSIEQIGLL